ncbi:hypothetical protein [Desulfotalea psychrophila]|uniref:DUF4403 family protein n=1 Tax=Desulfotalea psychrophila (strain LSv54 / DSM 12343) TaxID=177439 RepID=Q6AS70_DESPS|nr:hypothetical protein [Desulfotalea psychrophila]CAG34805.1 unknown protein [Desulfotalea psychrophila LSv54]
MLKYIALLTISLCSFCQAAYAQPGTPPIIVDLPEAVIEKALQEIIPLSIPTNSDSISGTIEIAQISELKLSNKILSCKTKLKGHNIQLGTKLGSQVIHLNVGEVETNFSTEATLRFDPAGKQIFIKPVLKNGSSDGDALSNALLLLLSGKEFPLKLEKIKPITAQIDQQKLFIDMALSDIIIKEGLLRVLLHPKVYKEKL